MGVVRIRRAVQVNDKLRSYRILMDGTCVGTIASRGELQLELPAGRHNLLARIDWCSSNAVTLNVEENSWHELEVGSPIRGWRLWVGAAFLYIAIWRSHYLYL